MKRKASSRVNQPFKKPRTTGPPLPKAAVGVPQELKYNDVPFATDATTTGVVVPLNTFGAGDTALLRDGNKILMRSLELRVRLDMEAVAPNAVCRFIVVHDKNANLTSPTIAGATGVLDAITPESLRTISGMSRYTILMDKSFALNTASASAPQKMFFKKYIKLSPELQLASFYDGGSSVPVSGSLTLLYFSDIAAGATDVNVNGQSRLRFVG
jgi:hypothetical protein